MSKLIYAVFILGSVLFSCATRTNMEVNFFGFAEEDTIYLYQDGECHFVTEGLVDQLSNEIVLSARFSITPSSHPYEDVTILNKSNYYLRDTISQGMLGELLSVDHEPEQFNTPFEYFSFYGALEVYYANGDTAAYADTITFTRINPLMNDKMVGELKNGQRVGEWLEYYDVERTKLARKSFFVNGQRQGVDTVFKKNEVAIIANWKNGKKHGICRHFRLGKIQHEIIFDEGTPKTYLKYLNSKGEVIDSLDLRSL
ncbi:MAG: hypothetical protein ABJF04_25655 [Reichenbachiella sp.]|uniref:toxin-antitoxin system YwqK family antitoxin n=1 Tax=Reichenbachiella sp. TaxID=2184521 RepID=UPI00326313D5